MTKTTVSKRELVRLVATRSGVTIAVAGTVYEALLTEITELARMGTQVNLTGFGRFYPQVHKGHPAQFGAAGKPRLPDYPKLKFSASPTLGKVLAASGRPDPTDTFARNHSTRGQGDDV